MITIEAGKGYECDGKSIKEMNKEELDYCEYKIDMSMCYSGLSIDHVLFYIVMGWSERLIESVKLHKEQLEQLLEIEMRRGQLKEAEE